MAEVTRVAENIYMIDNRLFSLPRWGSVYLINEAKKALVECGRALAMMRGRYHISIDDVRELAPSILRHRLILNFDAHADGLTADSLLARILGDLQPGEG